MSLTDRILRISDEALHAIIETLVFPSRYLGAPIPVAP